jgi:hypothetical protein
LYIYTVTKADRTQQTQEERNRIKEMRMQGKRKSETKKEIACTEAAQKVPGMVGIMVFQAPPLCLLLYSSVDPTLWTMINRTKRMSPAKV